MKVAMKLRKSEDGKLIPAVLISANSDLVKTGEWWEKKVREVPITMAELRAIKVAHKADAVNVERATKVKSLMLVGYSPLQIYTSLRPLGRGYGLSSIKHDHAALSKFQRSWRK